MIDADKFRLPLPSNRIGQLLATALQNIGSIGGWHHPLGFWHIKLGAVANCKVRLHIWPQSIPLRMIGTIPRIHNHAFNFVSQVISGRVVHTPYEIEWTPRGELQILRVKYSGASSTMMPTRRYCSIRRCRDQGYGVGDIYSMRAGAFHDAVGLDDLTATLLLETPGERVSSMIVGRHNMVSPHKLSWQLANENVLTKLLASLRHRIERRQTLDLVALPSVSASRRGPLLPTRAPLSNPLASSAFAPFSSAPLRGTSGRQRR